MAARPRAAGGGHGAGARARWRRTPSGRRCRRTGRRSWPPRRSTRRAWWRMRGRRGERADALVCEGVGGLLVPLTRGYSVRDLAVDLGPADRGRGPPRPGHDQPHPADRRGGAGRGSAGGRDRDDAVAAHAAGRSRHPTGRRSSGSRASACPAWRPPRRAPCPRREPRCHWTTGCHNPADDRAHRARGADAGTSGARRAHARGPHASPGARRGRPGAAAQAAGAQGAPRAARDRRPASAWSSSAWCWCSPGSCCRARASRARASS